MYLRLVYNQQKSHPETDMTREDGDVILISSSSGEESYDNNYLPAPGSSGNISQSNEGMTGDHCSNDAVFEDPTFEADFIVSCSSSSCFKLLYSSNSE